MNADEKQVGAPILIICLSVAHSVFLDGLCCQLRLGEAEEQPHPGLENP
jgi:hypothetical protein